MIFDLLAMNEAGALVLPYLDRMEVEVAGHGAGTRKALQQKSRQCGNKLLARQAKAASRLGGRKGHFFNPALLPSQFATLEEPADAVTVDIHAEPATIADRICKELKIAKTDA